MPAPEIVRQLMKRFEENLDSYRSSKYKEMQLRRKFLDPFFEALGWDVFNKAGYAEAYMDVFQEDSLNGKARHEKMVSLVERMLELPPLLSPLKGEEKVHARRG